MTSNPADTTTKTASYSGCGCAGGEVVTITDEGTIDGGTAKRRQQKVYSDVLGRTVKTEVLNWEAGSIYSAMVNTYNVRDQVTEIKQYAGPVGSTFQTTSMSYDGYGRLQAKQVPEQTAATTYAYNDDDTLLFSDRRERCGKCLRSQRPTSGHRNQLYGSSQLRRHSCVGIGQLLV